MMAGTHELSIPMILNLLSSEPYASMGLLLVFLPMAISVTIMVSPNRMTITM